MGAAPSHEPEVVDKPENPIEVAEIELTEDAAKVVIQQGISKIAKKRAARAAAAAEKAALTQQQGPAAESAAAKRSAGWAAKPTTSLDYYGNYGKAEAEAAKAEAEAAKAAKAAAKRIDRAAEQRLLCVCGFIAESPESLRRHFASSGVLRHYHDTRADARRNQPFLDLPMDGGSLPTAGSISLVSSSVLAKGGSLQLTCVCGFVADSPQVLENHIASSGILSHFHDYRAQDYEA